MLRNAQISTILWSLLPCLLLASASGAIVVNPATAPEALASALLGSNAGVVIRSSALEYRAQETVVSCGTYTNASGAYGLGPGVVLSTGDVSLCADNVARDLSYGYNVPVSSEINALLIPITGIGFHFDSTRLDIVFDLLPGYDSISIDTVFGSEEYPSWQNTMYNDGLGIYLNDVNIALTDDLPITISHPRVGPIPGTGLNGVLTRDGVPLLSFSKFLGNGALSNRLTIVIGDASDASLDTVVFVGNLRANQAAYGISNRAAYHPIMSTALAHFNYKVWGKVKNLVINSSFEVDDGSDMAVRVVAPGFGGIQNGDYASAKGKFSGEGSNRVLNAQASDVVKLR